MNGKWEKINYTHPVAERHPSKEGNFLEGLSLLDFLFPSWEGFRGGLYFSLFSSSSGTAKSNLKVYLVKTWTFFKVILLE